MSTPQGIRLRAGAALVVAVVLGVVVASMLTSLRSGFDVIGQRAAPQVAAGADLYVSLSDMDAQAANVLLVGNDAGLSDNRSHALAEYDQRRSEADTDIQRATQIAGTDPTVTRTVHAILDLFGQYQALAGEALYLNGTRHDPAGRPSATELGLYRQATAVMANALRDTQSLIDTSGESLDSAYDSAQADALAALLSVLVIGVALLVLLVVLQVFLRRRLRRRFNPLVAVATLLVLVTTVIVPVLLAGETGHLRTAKQDAFDSVIVLSEARAVSQEAAADESRFLLDPARAATYQRAFQSESQAVRGGLGTALARVTSVAEQWAALRVIARFQGYEQADHEMRATLAEGDLRDAIEFDTGSALGYSSYNLGHYDEALVTLTDTKQHTFDDAVRDGTDALAGWTGLVPAGVVVAVVLLVGAGVWPRLAEYRR